MKSPEQKAAEYILTIRPEYFVETSPKDLSNGYSEDQIESAYLAGYNADRWIAVEDGLPKPEVPVFAILKDSLRIMVMRRTYVDFEDDNSGYVWANQYGNIDGDAEFDDDYFVTHWQPLPSPPNQTP